MSKNCGDCDYFVWPVAGYCCRPGFPVNQVDSGDRACPGFAWTARFQTGEEKEKPSSGWYFDPHKYDWCCKWCGESAGNRIKEGEDPFDEPKFAYCPHCGKRMKVS